MNTYSRTLFILALSVFSSFNLSAQTIQLDIEHLSPISTKRLGSDYLIPNFSGMNLEGHKPFLEKTIEVADRETSIINCRVLQKTILSKETSFYFSSNGIQIPSEVSFESKISNTKKELHLKLFPYIQENNQFYKIEKLSLELSPNLVKKKRSSNFASKSVFSNPSDTWIKLAISKDGIYKVTYQDLLNYGINTANLSKQHIHIYGNASGRLPEQNNLPRPDDLQNNAIYISPSIGTTFSKDDYILFHAYGASRWKNKDGKFYRDLNIYNDVSYYYIRISSSETPKRIQSYPTYSIFTKTTNEFDYYDIIEKEDHSLINAGKRWYGEILDIELEKNYQFNLPSTTTTESNFQFSYATNARSTGNSIEVFNNQSRLLSSEVSSISTDYIRSESNFKLPNKGISSIPLLVRFNRKNSAVALHIDKIELNTRCKLTYPNFQLRIRDLQTVLTNSTTKFEIVNATNELMAWDVTSPYECLMVPLQSQSSSSTFILPTDTLREIVLFQLKDIYSPQFTEKVYTQNIHGSDYANLLIITPNEFKNQAQELKNIHENQGTKTQIIVLEELFNEFSCGIQDPTGIKWCVKMFYDRYKNDPEKQLKNVLLFGDGTFDPKNRANSTSHKIVTYQFDNSENHIDAMVSDDYFALLDDDESISGMDDVDVGIGRMLVSTNDQAMQLIEKIKTYINPTEKNVFGDWRTKIVQIADDEEDGWFILKDAEPQSAYVSTNHPEIVIDKIYCDASKQVLGSGGERYPDVVSKINSTITDGCLIMNYTGHGGESGAAEERIISLPQISNWKNSPKLPLFVSSTCEFTKYDNPDKLSAGELISLLPDGGAIALMTTTRPVFFSVNTLTGISFYQSVFERDENNQPLTFGEIIRRTKNLAGSSNNKRSFTLIGDPALQIGLPKEKISIDSINKTAIANFNDTLKALDLVEVTGKINSTLASKLTDGEILLTIYDKPMQVNTLGQNSDSPVIPFTTQTSLLFKGRASLKNGRFKLRFKLPKDLNYSYGAGKFAVYGQNEITDGLGVNNSIVIGGINNLSEKDSIGPTLLAYLNDPTFIDGGLVNESPTLYIELKDSNGINISTNGIGHSITGVLDGETSQLIEFNNYYTSDLNTYQSGKINYRFSRITPGKHQLKLKAWDNLNNSSSSTINFQVSESTKIDVQRLINYPNPFTNKTTFFFEHNQTGRQINTRLQIMTITGKVVQQFEKTLTPTTNLVSIDWDGKDEFGDQLAKGVYVYRLIITNNNNETVEKIEKLILL
jgi:hypothetical protein